MSETTEPTKQPIENLELFSVEQNSEGTIRAIILQFSDTGRERLSKTRDAFGWSWSDMTAELFAGNIRPDKMFSYIWSHTGGDIRVYYSLSGSHLNHVPEPKRTELLMADELYTEYHRTDLRQKAFHQHLLHSYSLGSVLSADTRALYLALLTQWAVAGFDKTNFSDETKWAIIQKIQAYTFIDFQADQLIGHYQGITPTTLSKPASENTDWVLRYPDTDGEGNRIIGSNSDMLDNAGSAHEQGTNYANTLYMLNFGTKPEWYGGI